MFNGTQEVKGRTSFKIPPPAKERRRAAAGRQEGAVSSGPFSQAGGHAPPAGMAASRGPLSGGHGPRLAISSPWSLPVPSPVVSTPAGRESQETAELPTNVTREGCPRPPFRDDLHPRFAGLPRPHSPRRPRGARPRRPRAAPSPSPGPRGA